MDAILANEFGRPAFDIRSPLDVEILVAAKLAPIGTIPHPVGQARVYGRRPIILLERVLPVSLFLDVYKPWLKDVTYSFIKD